jgi:hypothetical protein
MPMPKALGTARATASSAVISFDLKKMKKGDAKSVIPIQ